MEKHQIDEIITSVYEISKSQGLCDARTVREDRDGFKVKALDYSFNDFSSSPLVENFRRVLSRKHGADCSCSGCYLGT